MKQWNNVEKKRKKGMHKIEETRQKLKEEEKEECFEIDKRIVTAAVGKNEKRRTRWGYERLIYKK